MPEQPFVCDWCDAITGDLYWCDGYHGEGWLCDDCSFTFSVDE